MQRASDSAIGLPKRPTSASWMLAFLMPAEVRRYFIVTFPIGTQQFHQALRRYNPLPVAGEKSFSRQRVAQRRGRVDAEHRQLRGEEGQFFERELDAFILRMAFDVGVELRRIEGAAELVGLELRHVDAVG